ncbi:Undecaprenyl-diphosphatase [Rubellimicrobium thermophilum DSM 16684]|uniref:Undecaprenyl-diphosphatase n=1 Tax=Rubellimicrobium thermophilum DSM 16684 TaxID=1123069 RepID=S9S2W4_9RHOB|nr:undecaprenyl-diphosphate phosphatase [Rubellimicrobium thermophilum]EPX84525.1 Undecaprenyl-diphosphatase [Rubellimicrobium thermophilum DSM 16684]
MALGEGATALLLGVIEGLTEFIPVSSTGHLLLASEALGFHSTGRVFEVAIQLGAVLALVTVYAGRLALVFGTAHRDPLQRRFMASVLLAFLPAAALGVALHDVIKTVFFETPALIAWMLILGGLVLLAVDRLSLTVRHAEADRLPLRTSLAIGLCQCAALVPGVSRSGATIVGALLMGVSKRAAAEFSFFLSLPTMAGAVAYDLWQNRELLGSGDLGLIAIGLAAAFVTAALVVRTLLGFVSRHGYGLFGWWRILLGAIVLWTF